MVIVDDDLKDIIENATIKVSADSIEVEIDDTTE